MRNLLNQIIEEITGPIVLLDEFFSNETISDKNLSNSRFYKCQILRSDLTRVEFGNTSFTSCEFKQVDLSGSLFTNAQFSETKFEEILLIGLILSDLKIKPTTFHDLEFNKTYPVRIHKLKKVREVSDSNSFQKILEEFYFE